MHPFLDPGLPPDDNIYQLTSGFAKALNREGIPCVLWDKMMVTLFGGALEYGIRHVDFVVPDHLVQDARSALLQDKGHDFCIAFEDCPSTDTCPSIVCPTEFVPDVHLHTDFKFGEGARFPRIFIYGQSRVLWTLPPLDETYLPPPFGQSEELFHRTISPHYVLTTDKTACPPREFEDVLWHGKPWITRVKRFTVGLGVWDESLYPALAPKPRFAAEALARLDVRHFCEDRSFDAALSLASLGDVQRKNEFISFEGVHPLVRGLAQPWTTPKSFRQVMLELARLFGEHKVVDQLEWEEGVRKMYYPKNLRDFLP